MIVVAMTSWKMRIGNVENVVRSVFEGTLKPDRLYLTLSSDEFVNKEKSLPKSLVEMFDSDDRLFINWVGKNTKTMKKVFPILKFLDDDDFIINIDDDMLVPPNAIEHRISEYNGSPITSCNNPKCHMIDKELGMYSCGPLSLFKKKHLNNWKEFVDSNIVSTYNDDYTYTMICWLNGYRFVPCTDYSRHTGVSEHRIEKFNDVYPSFNRRLYLDRSVMYDALKRRVRAITHMSVKDSFGFFNGHK